MTDMIDLYSSINTVSLPEEKIEEEFMHHVHAFTRELDPLKKIGCFQDIIHYPHGFKSNKTVVKLKTHFSGLTDISAPDMEKINIVLKLYDPTFLKKLQKSLSTGVKSWFKKTDELLAPEDPQLRFLALYRLALTVYHTPEEQIPPALKFQTIERAMRSYCIYLYDQALLHISKSDAARLPLLEPYTTISDFIFTWDELSGIIFTIGTGYIEEIQELQEMLTEFRKELPQGEIMEKINAWFTAYPHLPQLVNDDNTTCSRFEPSLSPEFKQIRDLFEAPRNNEQLKQLNQLNQLKPSPNGDKLVKKLKKKIHEFETFDRAFSITHGLLMSEAMIQMIVRILQHHPVESGDMTCMALLNRTNSVLIPGQNHHEKIAEIIQALVFQYKGYEEYLIENILQPGFDIETQLEVLCTLEKRAPGKAFHSLSQTVLELLNQPGGELIAHHGIETLNASPHAEENPELLKTIREKYHQNSCLKN